MRGVLSVLVFSYAPLVSNILGMWNCVEVRTNSPPRVLVVRRDFFGATYFFWVCGRVRVVRVLVGVSLCFRATRECLCEAH